MDSFYQQLKNVSIVDIINNYQPLTKKGKSFVGVCPFHDDHSPSMSVDPTRNIFKCFSCGIGGNSIKYVQEYEHVSYREAAEKVGEMSGIHLEAVTTINEYEKRLYSINKMVAAYATFSLLANPKAMEYLENRGIKEADVKTFDIGYIENKEAFKNFLIKKGVTETELEEFDIFTKSYCRWSGRILFPIHDKGNIKGFTARKYSNVESDAKYVNSADSKYFHKGKLFFNLDNALTHARHSNELILMEGVGDVIPAFDAGIKNCVATLGTSLTDDHVYLIKKLNIPVRICYDGDSAGINAAKNAFTKLNKLDIDTRFTILPDQKDPGELIIENPKLFNQLICENNSYFDFLLSTAGELNTFQDKQSFAASFMDQLRNNPLAIDFYVPKLSEITGFSEAALKQKAEIMQSFKSPPVTTKKPSANDNKKKVFVKFNVKDKLKFETEVSNNYDRLVEHDQVVAFDETTMLERVDVLRKYMAVKGRIFSTTITCMTGHDEAEFKARPIIESAAKVIAEANQIPLDNVRYIGFLHKDTRCPHIHLNLWQEEPLLNKYELSTKLVKNLQKTVSEIFEKEFKEPDITLVENLKI